jgi:hypothetical protein
MKYKRRLKIGGDVKQLTTLTPFSQQQNAKCVK